MKLLSLAAALCVSPTRTAEQGDEDGASWCRMSVVDGVELHVRDGSTAAHPSAMVAMREAIRAALGREDVR